MATRLQSLEKGLNQWKWQAKNPDKNRCDYFVAHPKLTRPQALCFACGYAKTHGGEYCCHRCILSNIWKDGCTATPGSPYKKWRDAENDEDRTAAALEIVRGHEEAISRITQKESKK